MKNKNKTLDAVKRVLAGESKRSVSRATGLDTKTLSSNVSRFLADGEQGIVDRRSYSLEKKLEIVSKNIEDGRPIALLAAEYGIPAITLRRWVRRYQLHGPEGLEDKRRKVKDDEGLRLLEESRTMTQKAFELTLQALKGSDDGFIRQIPDTMASIGVFDNPGFGDFLHALTLFFLFRREESDSSCQQDEFGRLSENERSMAYSFARLDQLYFGNDVHRQETEKLFERDEVLFFTSIFIDMVYTGTITSRA